MANDYENPTDLVDYEGPTVPAKDTNTYSKFQLQRFFRPTFLQIIVFALTLLCIILSSSALVVSVLRGSNNKDVSAASDSTEQGEEAVTTTAATTAATTEPKINCPTDYTFNPFSGGCLIEVLDKQPWQDAKETCEARKEYFATFPTLESAYWLMNLRRTDPNWRGESVWVGSVKIAGIWQWEGKTRQRANNIPWGIDQPEPTSVEECLISWKVENYFYHDHGCENSWTFICEKFI